MTVPVALLLFAGAILLLASRVLTRAIWVHGSPRWGILAWQACVGAVLSAFVLLALTALVPVERISFDLAHLLHACAAALQDSYALSQAPGVFGASIAVAGMTVLLLLRATVLLTVRVARSRDRQRRLLDLLARDLDGHGAHVLAHDVPLAYCVPGGRGRIVLTTAARATLPAAELRAVVAHERAHLRGRHDLVLFGADVARTAFPWMRFFHVAHVQMTGLIEMLADDRAASRAGRLPLAAALLDLGTSPAHQSSVVGTGHMTTVRVARLVEGVDGLSFVRRLTAAVLCAGLLAAPWVMTVAPAWAARTGRCPGS